MDQFTHPRFFDFVPINRSDMELVTKLTTTERGGGDPIRDFVALVVDSGVTIDSPTLFKRYGIKEHNVREEKRLEQRRAETAMNNLFARSSQLLLQSTPSKSTSSSSSSTKIVEASASTKTANKKRKREEKKEEEDDDDPEFTQRVQEAIQKKKLERLLLHLTDVARITLYNLLRYAYAVFGSAKLEPLGEVPLAIDLGEYHHLFRFRKDGLIEPLFLFKNSKSRFLTESTPLQFSYGPWFVNMQAPTPDGHLHSILVDIAPQAFQIRQMTPVASQSEINAATQVMALTHDAVKAFGSATDGQANVRPQQLRLPIARMETIQPTYRGGIGDRFAEFDEVIKRRKLAELRESGYGETSMQSTNTSLLPAPGEQPHSALEVQDLTNIASTAMQVKSESTQISMQGYDHWMRQHIAQGLGLIPSVSQEEGESKHGRDRRKDRRPKDDEAQTGNTCTTLLFWGNELKRVLESLLEQVCGLEDATVELNSVINAKRTLALVREGSIVPTDKEAKSIASAFHIDPQCITTPEEEARATELLKARTQLLTTLIQLRVKERESKMKMAEANQKMKIEEKKAALQMTLLKEKSAYEMQHAAQKQEQTTKKSST
jgi:hypothetical protein